MDEKRERCSEMEAYVTAKRKHLEEEARRVKEVAEDMHLKVKLLPAGGG